MHIVVRAYQTGDAEALADVMYRSVRHAALADYTARQVEAWLPARPSAWQMARWAGDGRTVLVAANDGSRVVALFDEGRSE